MAYFNPLMNEILMKERQLAFQREADERRLVRLAETNQPRQKTKILMIIQNLASKLPRRQPATLAACVD